MAFKVGFLYFLITFVFAFVMGIVRVTFVIPLVGELSAVLMEVPLIIFVSWKVSAVVKLRYFSDRTVRDYLVVGLIAFFFLMVTEYFLAVFAFGRTSREYFLSLQTASGLIGLLGQMGFAALPSVQQKIRGADGNIRRQKFKI
jgi:hypothetical protein